MATLFEYFKKDQGRALALDQQWEIREGDGTPLTTVIARVLSDFEANAHFVAFYLPATDKVKCPARMVLNSIDRLLAGRNDVYVTAGHAGAEPSSSDESVFTGRIYIYSESEISEADKAYIRSRAAELKHSVKFRDQSYAAERNKYESPLAFISHDTRDKELIAGPLALELQKISCPVWYDEYTLKVGDSLRESIERGLKECRKCILILTPNFLSNEGWGKKEFESVFTRELIEQKNVILPVWENVTPKDIYEYSPALANRFALSWKGNPVEIARKLYAAIE